MWRRLARVSRSSPATARVRPAHVPPGSGGRHPVWVDGILLAVVLVWGGNFVAMKVAFEDIDRDVFNAIRFLAAAGVAVPWAVGSAWRSRWIGAVRPRLAGATIGGVIAAALLGNVVYQWVFAAGVDGTSPGKAAILLATTPLWVALANRLGGRRIPGFAWIGMLMAILGVAILVGDRRAGGSLRGDLIMLAASMLWAGSIGASRRAMRHCSPVPFHAISVVIGAFGLGALVGATDIVDAISGASPRSVAMILYCGPLSIGAGFLAWAVAIRASSSLHVANYQNLVPIVALAAEAILLGGVRFMWYHWLAAAITIAGVALTRRATSAPSATTAGRNGGVGHEQAGGDGRADEDRVGRGGETAKGVGRHEG